MRRPGRQALLPSCRPAGRCGSGGPGRPEREGVRRSGPGLSRLAPGPGREGQAPWSSGPRPAPRLSKGGLGQASGGGKLSQRQASGAGPRRLRAQLGAGGTDPWGSPSLKGGRGLQGLPAQSRIGELDACRSKVGLGWGLWDVGQPGKDWGDSSA